MMEDGAAEVDKVAMAAVHAVEAAPPEVARPAAAREFGRYVVTGRPVVRRSVLKHEVMARDGRAGDAVAVGINIGRYEGKGQAQGRRDGRRGRGRTAGGGAIGEGGEGMVGVELVDDELGGVAAVLALDVAVEDAEADAGGGEVAADGELDGGEAIIGEGIRAGYDRKDIHPGRQAPDGGNVGLRERRATEQRVRGHGRLEDDGLEVGLVEAVVAGAGDDGRGGQGDGGRDNGVGVEEVDAPMSA